MREFQFWRRWPFSVGTSQAPTLSAITVSPASVNETQSTALSVTASDPQRDPLSFSWAQVSPATPKGTFTNGSTASPTWKAPPVTATTAFTLQVTVSDGKGGTSQRTVDLQVVDLGKVNTPPTVSATITAPASVLAGDPAALSITASDADGDPLTYTWQTSPASQGSFTSASTASTSWSSPDIAAVTNFTLQVTVSDGTDSVTRSVVVKATVPTYAANIQTIWTQRCTSCHDNTSPSGGMNLLSGSSWTSLVGVNGNNKCSGTTAIPRVSANQPDGSLLVRKISRTDCGTQMPQGNSTYFVNNPGLVIRIRSWIRAGALNN